MRDGCENVTMRRFVLWCNEYHTTLVANEYGSEEYCGRPVSAYAQCDRTGFATSHTSAPEDIGNRCVLEGAAR